ncbi:MAG: ATP synthase F1 subunit delta [Thermaurantimonas sp.]|uniref:ATP synthase F1 subunit delta n=1 Tax=Thermaurantimonas sp. TaxID=2681568 RepID=UPI00391B6B29
MKIPKLANRYAKALLELAHERNAVEQVRDDMKFLLDTITNTTELQILLKSPVIKTDQKKKVMDEIGKHLHEITASFVRLLIHHRRESSIQEIAFQFLQQYRIFKGIHLIQVISAHPLSPTLKENLIKKLKSHIGGIIELEEVVSPDLIGGLIIRINDKEFNASVKNQLNEFKKSFATNLYKPSF